MKDFLSFEDKLLWDTLCKEVHPLKRICPKEPKFVQVKTRPFYEKPSIHKVRRGTPIGQPCYTLSSLESRDLKAVKLEGRLDLHGLPLKKAMETLDQFMAESYWLKRRWVIVITGKGLHSPDYSQGGVIKKFTQEWFHQNAHFIIGFSEANLNHGGSGAFYVRLRRSKN